MNNILKQKIYEKILEYNTIIINTHKNPDLDALGSQAGLFLALKKAFPKNTQHTSAIKANHLVKVLEKFKSFGFGLEAASEGEIHLAEKSGFKSDTIVFDSPVKTISEIQFALQKGFYLNADSLIELERINSILQSLNSESKIGLRINPQVGIGKIEQTSVAGEYSKFGVPVKSLKKEIINSFIKYDWLQGIHLHIGSQACDMEMLLNGFEITLQLVTEINTAAP